MVVTRQITPGQFLQGYSEGSIRDVFVVNLNGEQRAYGKTGLDAADQPEGYVVVYAVVPP